MVLQLAEYAAAGSAGRRPGFRGARALRAPGRKAFTITGVRLTAENGAGSGDLVLAARVSGANIAYIYSEILLKDAEADRFYGPVAREHVPAGHTKVTRGLSRPQWDDPVDVTVTMHPALSVLTDGAAHAFCFSLPEAYGSPDRHLDGLYAPAGSDVPLAARLVFGAGGEFKRASAQAQPGRRSGPRALTPKPGDRFTPFVQVLTPPHEGGEWAVTTALSTPLTFGEQSLSVIKRPLPLGEYLAGVVVQDFDGGLTREYAPLTVHEPGGE
jgi:hypothetical protein